MTRAVGTPSGAGESAKSRKPSGGLHLERVWTTAGVHPYDEVTWERRDVVMTNWRDGSIVFEQRGVEFPTAWSINAANIVTTKYFRGAVGTPQREVSLRQLIDRVVLTYTKAGVEHGYFATSEDAEIFEHELTWMLLHQVFSFNSPVWFNVGTPSKQQVSACFILSVDDSMESILDWYKEEGLIFQGGSGAGVNLSRIRASSELLSSGGEASGPVSFMRGADASAGTIKSGGATRRAAKMVILDVDHPDVEEFIGLKAREEHKIRALRDAGFDMELGGKDTTSVQYQNANNSVRVSDEFMEAVEKGGTFDLVGRLDGRVIKTVDAKSLFRQIAQAAWECADPGLQYDGTINDWHTNPETGRITASNPCSEYMSLDNSSCNLASLNLMKFRTATGGFEIEKFVKSVELVITAMDISICFADFPTEKIAETTRAYRQLGIGYANLGALLMASGLPYDSDGGRSVAAAITSLMTGAAYRRSAELAGVVGPYDGYARNAEPHKRVMRKHAAANDEIKAHRLATPIVREATKQWQQCLKIGEKNGYRNAQASLLAPTGTIGLMMDCDTTGIEPDLALVKFKKLVGGGSMQIVNQTVPRGAAHPGLPGGAGRGDRRVHRRARPRGERARTAARALPGLRLRDGRADDRADGARADDGGGPAVPQWRDQQDGQHAGVGHRRGRRGRLLPGLEAGPQGDRDLPRQLQGRPAVLNVGGKKKDAEKAEPEKVVEYRPTRKRLPKKRPGGDGVVLGRGCRGLHDRLVLPGRRSRRGLPQDVQAGLDAGRRDGRVLHRHLGRPAVRRAAGDVRLEVHEHAVRAGRHDRRPGHPDGGIGGGLHLPPAGAGLPADRAPGRARHLHRQGAGRAGAGRGRRRGVRPGRARRQRADRGEAGRRGERRRVKPSRPPSPRRSRSASRSRGPSGPRWSCWKRWRTRSPTRRSASPAAPRCARPVAATSARAAAPPAAAASLTPGRARRSLAV